jgi:hypothetical protein
MIVQLRRQAGDIDVIEPERKHLARQRAAGDDEDPARAVPAARVARLGEDVGGRALAPTVIPANAGTRIMRRRRLSQ